MYSKIKYSNQPWNVKLNYIFVIEYVRIKSGGAYEGVDCILFNVWTHP